MATAPNSPNVFDPEQCLPSATTTLLPEYLTTSEDDDDDENEAGEILDVPCHQPEPEATPPAAKKRKRFGRSRSEVRVLQAQIDNCALPKRHITKVETQAMETLKTKDYWVPIPALSMFLLVQEGDWVMFTKPIEYTNTFDPAMPRKRNVAKVLAVEANKITLSTIQVKAKGGYEWSFQWDSEADRKKINDVLSGAGRRQFYMRRPSDERKYPRKNPSEEKSNNPTQTIDLTIPELTRTDSVMLSQKKIAEIDLSPYRCDDEDGPYSPIHPIPVKVTREECPPVIDLADFMTPAKTKVRKSLRKKRKRTKQ